MGTPGGCGNWEISQEGNGIQGEAHNHNLGSTWVMLGPSTALGPMKEVVGQM